MPLRQGLGRFAACGSGSQASGHRMQLGVRVLALRGQELEGSLCIDAAGHHDDPLGLFDDGPVGEGTLKCVVDRLTGFFTQVPGQINHEAPHSIDSTRRSMHCMVGRQHLMFPLPGVDYPVEGACLAPF